MPEEPPHTCPQIDEALDSANEARDRLDNLRSLLEDLRHSNSELRSWGEEEREEREEKEQRLEEAEDTIQELRDERDRLSEENQRLRSIVEDHQTFKMWEQDSPQGGSRMITPGSLVRIRPSQAPQYIGYVQMEVPSDLHEHSRYFIITLDQCRGFEILEPAIQVLDPLPLIEEPTP